MKHTSHYVRFSTIKRLIFFPWEYRQICLIKNVMVIRKNQAHSSIISQDNIQMQPCNASRQ